MPVRRKKTRVTQQHDKEDKEIVRATRTSSTNVTKSKSPEQPSASTQVKTRKTHTDRSAFTALKENNKCLAAALGMFHAQLHFIFDATHQTS